MASLFRCNSTSSFPCSLHVFNQLIYLQLPISYNFMFGNCKVYPLQEFFSYYFSRWSTFSFHLLGILQHGILFSNGDQIRSTQHIFIPMFHNEQCLHCDVINHMSHNTRLWQFVELECHRFLQGRITHLTLMSFDYSTDIWILVAQTAQVKKR